MTLALVLVEYAEDFASSTERAVSRVRGVFETHSIQTGSQYDLLVKVQSDDDKQLKDAIIALKSIAGIAAIAVSVVYGSAL
jgi:hypothetical protein